MRFSAHRLLRSAAFLGFIALAGCGSGSRGSGYATFGWMLTDPTHRSDPYYSLSCEQVEAAAVVVTLTDVKSGEVYTQPAVACSAMGMSTNAVPAGAYHVGFDLYGDPEVYGNTSTALDSFDIFDDNNNRAVFHILNGANDFTRYADGTPSPALFIVRSLFVDWTFASGRPSAVCAGLGVRYVELDFSTTASTTAVTTQFDCATESGLSLPYPYGPTSLNWRMYMVNAAGERSTTYVEGSTTLPLATPDFADDESDVDIGTVTFQY